MFHPFGLKKLIGFANMNIPAMSRRMKVVTNTRYVITFGQQITKIKYKTPIQRAISKEIKTTSKEWSKEFLVWNWGEFHIFCAVY